MNRQGKAGRMRPRPSLRRPPPTWRGWPGATGSTCSASCSGWHSWKGRNTSGFVASAVYREAARGAELSRIELDDLNCRHSGMRPLKAQTRNPYSQRWLESGIDGSAPIRARNARPGMTAYEISLNLRRRCRDNSMGRDFDHLYLERLNAESRSHRCTDSCINCFIGEIR